MWPNLAWKRNFCNYRWIVLGWNWRHETSLGMNKSSDIVICRIFVSPWDTEASWRKGYLYLLTCCRIVIFSCCQPVVAHWSLLAGGALSPDWVELATLLLYTLLLPQKHQHTLSRAEVIMRTHYPGWWVHIITSSKELLLFSGRWYWAFKLFLNTCKTIEIIAPSANSWKFAITFRLIIKYCHYNISKSRTEMVGQSGYLLVAWEVSVWSWLGFMSQFAGFSSLE